MAAIFMPGILELLIIFGVAAGMIGLVVAVVVAATRRSGASQANNPNLAPRPDCVRLIPISARIIDSRDGHRLVCVPIVGGEG